MKNDRKRGRPRKGISELSEKQVEVLMLPITRLEKAAKLNMSVGWVAKWERRLHSKLEEAFSVIRLRK